MSGRHSLPDPDDEPTGHLPPVDPDADRAWSRAEPERVPDTGPPPEPDPQATAAYDRAPAGSDTPAPPHNRDESNRDSAPARTVAVAIGVVLLLVVLIAGVVWALTRHRDDGTVAAPPGTTTAVTSQHPTSSSAPPSTSSTAPGPDARCGREYLWRQFGTAVQVRECDADHALLEMSGGEHTVGLYHWDRERWVFVADPYSGGCREQLEGTGVPVRFLRDFPPCDHPAASSPTESTGTGSSPGGTGHGTGDSDSDTDGTGQSGTRRSPTTGPSSGARTSTPDGDESTDPSAVPTG